MDADRLQELITAPVSVLPTSGVSHGSYIDPVLMSIFINNFKIASTSSHFLHLAQGLNLLKLTSGEFFSCFYV